MENRMLEVIIDRWSKSGKTDYMWSIWRDGQRVYQGGVHDSDGAAREAAVGFCQHELKAEPDQITEL